MSFKVTPFYSPVFQNLYILLQRESKQAPATGVWALRRQRIEQKILTWDSKEKRNENDRVAKSACLLLHSEIGNQFKMGCYLLTV